MNDKPITVSSHGSQRVTVDNLTPEEVERLRASMLFRQHWVRRGADGRLEHVPAYKELPDAVTDDSMLPFWRRPTEHECRQGDMFGFDLTTEAFNRDSSSVYITSLCGYDYSPENYKFQAEQLTEWGFVCMRSPRDSDSGQFWEVWFLPGVWAAKGRLKEAVSGSRTMNREEKFELMLKFLRRNASFGSLDVTIQRIAMVMD